MSKIATYSIVMIVVIASGVSPIFAQDVTDKIIPAKFVDTAKDPTYYIERYYDEPTYKSWFDRNYPDYTIEEAVMYNITVENKLTEIIQKEIIPEAEAVSIPVNTENISNTGETAQIALAVTGLVILFGATYGVKRKVDVNSRQISINRESLKQKIIKPIIGSDPLKILQTRLAKGEITLNEFEELRKFLK